jgi:hypothetical protein
LWCDWVDTGGAGSDRPECELESRKIVSGISTGGFAVRQSETELGLLGEEIDEQIIGFGKIVEDHGGCPGGEGAVGKSRSDEGSITNFMAP